jgi:hypothetical protein
VLPSGGRRLFSSGRFQKREGKSFDGCILITNRGKTAGAARIPVYFEARTIRNARTHQAITPGDDGCVGFAVPDVRRAPRTSGRGARTIPHNEELLWQTLRRNAPSTLSALALAQATIKR